MPKVKVPGSWRLSVGSWRVSVFCRFLGVISGSLSVSVCSWRLYVGSWRSYAVPGGYLVQGVLLSCSGQLKTYLCFQEVEVQLVLLKEAASSASSASSDNSVLSVLVDLIDNLNQRLLLLEQNKIS